MYQYLYQRFNLDPRQVGRLGHFWGLGVTFMATSVFGYTIASSIFLTRFGADQIPFAYLFMGLLFIPIYLWFSRIIDRFNRSNLTIIILILATMSTAGLRLILPSTHNIVYFAVYIYFFMIWVLLVDIMLPSLLMDFFSIGELKRAATLNVLAITFGGLIGGGLASLLVRYSCNEDLLVVPAALYMTGVLQIIYLAQREKPLTINDNDIAPNTLRAIKVLPKLSRSYPIVWLIMVSVFLFILLNCIAEFCVFTIYAKAFPNPRTLTEFLGTLVSIQSLLQCLLVIFLSGPLIRYFGVPRMNLVYPVTTLISFVALRFWFRLPSAIGAHINYDALYQSIDKPTFSLNYNALPPKYIGMAHVLGDGIAYVLGIAAAGMLLLAARNTLSIDEIIQIGIVLSCLFVIARVFLSGSYLKSLVKMLKKHHVDLDSVSNGFSALSSRYAPQIERLLNSHEKEERLLGFKFALRLKKPEIFFDQLKKLVKDPDSDIRARTRTLLREHPRSRLAPVYGNTGLDLEKVRKNKKIQPEVQRPVEVIVTSMDIPNRKIRQNAARELATSGRPGIKEARKRLASESWYEAETAAYALSLRHGWMDEFRLIAAQEKYLVYIHRSVKLVKSIPGDESGWSYLEIAIQDFWKRTVDRVFLLAGALVNERTVKTAHILLKSSDIRVRSNAIETVLSLGKDRLITPLLPLFESWDGSRFNFVKNPESPDPVAILEEASKAPDRWIRIGTFLTAEKQSLPLENLQPSDSDASLMRENPMDALFSMKKSVLFEELSMEELLVVYQALEKRRYDPEEIICEEGDTQQDMFVILEGSIQVYQERDGKRTVLATLEKGDFFGEMSMLEGIPRVASVSSRTNSELLRWTSDQFLSLTEQYPEILRSIAKVLSFRLRQFDNSRVIVG